MAAIKVTIKGQLKDVDSGNSEAVELIGELSLTGLTVGGGPIIPPEGETPPVDPPKPDDKPPAFIPIWLPDYGWIMLPSFPIPTPSKRK